MNFSSKSQSLDHLKSIGRIIILYGLVHPRSVSVHNENILHRLHKSYFLSLQNQGNICRRESCFSIIIIISKILRYISYMIFLLPIVNFLKYTVKGNQIAEFLLLPPKMRYLSFFHHPKSSTSSLLYSSTSSSL